MLLFFFNRGTPVPASWSVEGGSRDDVFSLFNLAQNILTNALLPSLLGLLILSRRPRHPIGRLLYLTGLVFGCLFFLQEATVYGNFTEPGRVPGALYIAWVVSLLWIIPFALLLTTVAIFPDGQLPALRWRWVLWLIALFTIGMLVSEVTEQPMTSAYNLENPVASSPLPEQASLIVELVAAGSMLLAVLGLVVLTVARFRRAVGVQRQQFKWLAWSLLISLFLSVAGVVSTEVPQSRLGEVMINWSILMPLFGIGVAILRFRLYDIDVIINRTLVYSSLTLALALMYFGSIALLQNAFRALSGQNSDFAIVVSTLAIAAMFDPLRRQIQRFIDHRFYRRKYNAQQVLAAFGTSLRDETDLDHLLATIVAVADATLQPAQLSIWLPGQAGSVLDDLSQ